METPTSTMVPHAGCRGGSDTTSAHRRPCQSIASCPKLGGPILRDRLFFFASVSRIFQNSVTDQRDPDLFGRTVAESDEQKQSLTRPSSAGS